MIENVINACIESICHKFVVEDNVTLLKEEGMTKLTYPSVLHHPWPRAFDYHTEYFVYKPAISRPQIEQPHVVQLFVETLLPVYLDNGYTLAWQNHILSCSPQQTDIMPLFSIRLANCDSDFEAIETLQTDHPSHKNALDAPDLHDFVATIDNQIVAHAQLVTINSESSYVSGMFTHPSYRRRGLGQALLQHIHAFAYEQGVKMISLIPSRMTRETGFYDKQGYTETAPFYVLIPSMT